MKLSKAIEILTRLLADRQDLAKLPLGAAFRLGVEALKGIQNCRHYPECPFTEPLPGETKD